MYYPGYCIKIDLVVVVLSCHLPTLVRLIAEPPKNTTEARLQGIDDLLKPDQDVKRNEAWICGDNGKSLAVSRWIVGTEVMRNVMDGTSLAKSDGTEGQIV